MSDSTILNVSNLGLAFGRGLGLFSKPKLPVLHDISFSLQRGETLGLVGTNGAGKSTLLKVIAGIYQPTQGQINCFAKSVSLLNLQLGFDENLNAQDNIILSGMLMGVSKKRMQMMSQEIIEYAELSASAQMPIRNYSTGMRARLGFAISKCSRPDIILLDEVLSVGDGHFREKAENTMREMILGNQTVVFVSHDSKSIRELCSRVCWLDGGRVKLIGDTALVMDEYEKYILQK